MSRVYSEEWQVSKRGIHSNMNVQMKTLPFPLVREQIDWKALYREQMPKIYNYFRYRIGNNMVAEDLTAITFEKAWRARKSYLQDKAAFTTWLYTIARNVMADNFRRAQDDLNLDLAEQIPAKNPDPEHALITKQNIQQLIDTLATYSTRDRDLIALKYGAGLNNREISGLTGLSESNVGTILHRTVSKLRNQMERNHE